MRIIRITVPMNPVAKARPRLGRNGVFTPTRTRNAEKFLKLHFNTFGPPRGEPCSVEIVFHCAHKDKKLWGKPKPTKPDIDNLIKLTADAMNGILLLDDSQIYTITARKLYAETGSIELYVIFDC